MLKDWQLCCVYPVDFASDINDAVRWKSGPFRLTLRLWLRADKYTDTQLRIWFLPNIHEHFSSMPCGRGNSANSYMWLRPQSHLPQPPASYPKYTLTWPNVVFFLDDFVIYELFSNVQTQLNSTVTVEGVKKNQNIFTFMGSCSIFFLIAQ